MAALADEKPCALSDIYFLLQFARLGVIKQQIAPFDACHISSFAIGRNIEARCT